jgi:Glycosyl hydrolase family 99
MAVASRRAFLERALWAGAASSAMGLLPATPAWGLPRPNPGTSPLLQRFPDLHRHFIFEYYPWYGGPPDYVHWDYLDRHPPDDIASNFMPRLGPYDVTSFATLEQHARWIHQAGVGAIALSWWGRGSYMDLVAPRIMDVMRGHGIKVTFAMEPYANDRGRRFADDILYLVDRFGEQRRFDALLLLRNADGQEGPVFKGFRCILPESTTDCRGQVHLTADFTSDATWREQTDRLRNTLRGDFDHITLLADSLEFARTPASGFDGIGIYDNFIAPERYPSLAEGASRAGLVFSFNVNPGYDQIEPRVAPPVGSPAPDPTDPCYVPRPTAAAGDVVDWTRAQEREKAAQASEVRIGDSFAATVEVQTDLSLTNARRGFFLVYINSFNEWHEGHAFEPMRDAADLLPAERPFGYHNPARGDYRLTLLAGLMSGLLRPDPEAPDPYRQPADQTTRRDPVHV